MFIFPIKYAVIFVLNFIIPFLSFNNYLLHNRKGNRSGLNLIFNRKHILVVIAYSLFCALFFLSLCLGVNELGLRFYNPLDIIPVLLISFLNLFLVDSLAKRARLNRSEKSVSMFKIIIPFKRIGLEISEMLNSYDDMVDKKLNQELKIIISIINTKCGSQDSLMYLQTLCSKSGILFTFNKKKSLAYNLRLFIDKRGIEALKQLIEWGQTAP